MPRGITVTNYLASGDPEGIIYSYLSNWTGQAIKIPRNLLVEAKDSDELDRPGVYFLFGQNPDNPDDKMVYIGEANKLSSRLLQHLKDADKSFFETIICFCSKDENLTVSHTKYLEHLIISKLGLRADIRMFNKKDGTKISLPQMVKDEMETYVDNMKIILPTLGFHVLDAKENNAAKNEIIEDFYYLNIGGIQAKAKLRANGIEVFADSQMNAAEVPKLSDSYRNMRKTLMEKGIVIEKNTRLIFVQDYLFTSPSTAAAIIMGYSINGRTAWKNKAGKTLNEIEEGIEQSND